MYLPSTTPKKTIDFFFLSLISIFLISFVSAVKIEDTVFFSSISNSTVYINSSVWADAFEVTNQSLKIYNLTSNSTDTPIFENINATYNARIDLYGNYVNVLCYDSDKNICNGTSSTITLNTGTNFNITILPNKSIYIFNNYQPTSTQPQRESDSVYNSSKKIINNILSTTITIPVNNSLGDNYLVTLNSGENASFDLIVNYNVTYSDYEQSTSDLLAALVVGLNTTGSFTQIFLVLGGLIVVVSIIIILIIYILKIKNNKSEVF